MPPRALHDGLDDDGRGLLGVDCQQVGELGDVAVVERLGEARAGHRSEDLLGQHACEHRVHPVVGIAHRHAPKGVAVVAAPHGEQAPAGGPRLTPGELQGHLDGDLHRDRARVRQEDVVEPRWRDVDQHLGQLDRRMMGHPAEHHVGHVPQLGTNSLVEHRVAVPVDGRPPRRHAVDHLGAVRQGQPDSSRRRHHDRVDDGGHRRVRVPQPSPIPIKKRLPCHAVSACADFRHVKMGGRSAACEWSDGCTTPMLLSQILHYHISSSI